MNLAQDTSPLSAPASAGAGRHGRLVLVAAWLVVALGAVAAGLSIWLDRQSTLDAARTDLGTMVRALCGIFTAI